MKHNISKLDLLNPSYTIFRTFCLPRLPIDNSHNPRQRNPRVIKIGDMPSESADVEIGDIHTEEDRDHISNIIDLPCAGIVNPIRY